MTQLVVVRCCGLASLLDDFVDVLVLELSVVSLLECIASRYGGGDDDGTISGQKKRERMRQVGEGGSIR